MTKKKVYKPKSKNVSLLSVYLESTKNTNRNPATRKPRFKTRKRVVEGDSEKIEK